MAQVCGGSPYDNQGRPGIAIGLRLLGAAAETWAMHGKDAVNFDAVLALILRVLLAPAATEALPLSLGACLERIGAPDVQIRRFRHKIPGATPDKAMEEAGALLTAAVESWCLGNPATPSPERVLHAVATLLHDRRLLRRRPPPRFEY